MKGAIRDVKRFVLIFQKQLRKRRESNQEVKNGPTANYKEAIALPSI